MKERRERATLCHRWLVLIEIKVCRRGPVIDFSVHERTLLQIDRQFEAAGHLRVALSSQAASSSVQTQPGLCVG